MNGNNPRFLAPTNHLKALKQNPYFLIPIILVSLTSLQTLMKPLHNQLSQDSTYGLNTEFKLTSLLHWENIVQKGGKKDNYFPKKV